MSCWIQVSGSPFRNLCESREATFMFFFSLWWDLGEPGEGWLRAGLRLSKLGEYSVMTRLIGWRLGKLKHPSLPQPNISLPEAQRAAAIPDQTEKSFVMVSHRAGLCFVSVRRPQPLPGRCLGWIAVWWNATLPSGSSSIGYRNRVLRKQRVQLPFQ